MTTDTLLNALSTSPEWWWYLLVLGVFALTCGVVEAAVRWTMAFRIPRWTLLRGECADEAWRQHQDWCRDHCGAGRPCDIGRQLQRRQGLAA